MKFAIKDLVSNFKSHFVQSRILNFNQVERDLWVRQKAAALSKGSAVLDVGAGSCPYRHYFSHCTYQTQDFTGLKPDQLRDRSGYGSIDYICDATAIPVANGEFDAVLCTEVLEHVPEPIEVVKELARVLKRGGKLLLTAPLGSGLHQEPYHFYGGYTPCWYQKFFREAGFADVSIEPNGGFFKHYGQESIRFAKMIAPWNVQVPVVARLILSPFWLISLPWFILLAPLLCHFLDRLDREKKFTVGYHVIAIKGPAAG